MIDRVLGTTALLVFMGFLGVLVWRAPLLDLAIVLVLVFVMAAYDFWISLFKRRS